MENVYIKTFDLISKSLDGVNLKLPKGFILYSTFFKNKTCSIILVADCEDNKNLEEMKIKTEKLGKIVYKKIKKYLHMRDIDKYLFINNNPKLEVVEINDKKISLAHYNLIYSINLCLGHIDETYRGYLTLMAIEDVKA